MILEEAFVAMLKADAGVSGVVGAQIYPLPLPEGTWQTCALGYSVITAPPDYPLRGPRFDTTTTIQVDCVARVDPDGFLTAAQAANAVIAAVESWAPVDLDGISIKDAWINDEHDDNDPDAREFRRIVDCGILWS